MLTKITKLDNRAAELPAIFEQIQKTEAAWDRRDIARKLNQEFMAKYVTSFHDESGNGWFSTNVKEEYDCEDWHVDNHGADTSAMIICAWPTPTQILVIKHDKLISKQQVDPLYLNHCSVGSRAMLPDKTVINIGEFKQDKLKRAIESGIAQVLMPEPGVFIIYQPEQFIGAILKG